MLLHLKPYSLNLNQTHSTPDLLPIHKINPQWVVSPGWDSSACAAVCTVLRLHCNKFKAQKNKIISHLSIRLYVPGCLLIFSLLLAIYSTFDVTVGQCGQSQLMVSDCGQSHELAPPLP